MPREGASAREQEARWRELLERGGGACFFPEGSRQGACMGEVVASAGADEDVGGGAGEADGVVVSSEGGAPSEMPKQPRTWERRRGPSLRALAEPGGEEPPDSERLGLREGSDAAAAAREGIPQPSPLSPAAAGCFAPPPDTAAIPRDNPRTSPPPPPAVADFCLKLSPPAAAVAAALSCLRRDSTAASARCSSTVSETPTACALTSAASNALQAGASCGDDNDEEGSGFPEQKVMASRSVAAAQRRCATEPPPPPPPPSVGWPSEAPVPVPPAAFRWPPPPIPPISSKRLAAVRCLPTLRRCLKTA